MKTRLFFLLFIVSVFVLNAQQASKYPEQFRDFTLKSYTHVVSNSLYNNIKLIDLRKDTLRLGQCQFGFLKKIKTLTPKPTLSIQVSDLLANTIDQTAKKGDLVLFLKRFIFTAFTPKGNFLLKANLFRKSDSLYSFIQSIDTVIRLNKEIVTDETIRLGDSVLCNFITRNLLNVGDLKRSFAYKDALFFDNIEKQKLKLYNTTPLVDGIYYSYESFKNQIPDNNGVVVRKNDKIKSVKSVDKKGFMAVLQPQSIYALVKDGLPFISNGLGYYPLVMRDGDFVFIGKYRESNNSGRVAAAAFVFGYLGALAASQAEFNTYFYCELNYKNGNIMRVCETPIDINASSSVYCYDNGTGLWTLDSYNN